MGDWAPWLVLAGLGAFHGLNPAMGWLFAAALGLQQGRSSAVWEALPPIAIGHLAAVSMAATALLAAGAAIHVEMLKPICGAALIAWGLVSILRGHHPRRVRFGMTAGALGLGTWSFLMAHAHGAGLMLAPALIALCLGGTPGELEMAKAAALAAENPIMTAAWAVMLHSGAMLVVAASIALAVYHLVGVGFLRRGWVNIDRIWTAALIGVGLWLVLA